MINITIQLRHIHILHIVFDPVTFLFINSTSKTALTVKLRNIPRTKIYRHRDRSKVLNISSFASLRPRVNERTLPNETIIELKARSIIQTTNYELHINIFLYYTCLL